MATQESTPRTRLEGLAAGDFGMVDTLARMTEGTLDASGLDSRTFMLVRMAALATLDASPESWLANLVIGDEAGVTPEAVLGTLVAVAPVIGTARVVSASSKILQAMDVA